MTDDQHTPTGDENAQYPALKAAYDTLGHARKVVRQLALEQLGLALEQQTLTGMLEAVYRVGYEDGIESTEPTILRLQRAAFVDKHDVPQSAPEK